MFGEGLPYTQIPVRNTSKNHKDMDIPEYLCSVCVTATQVSIISSKQGAGQWGELGAAVRGLGSSGINNPVFALMAYSFTVVVLIRAVSTSRYNL